MTTNSARNQKKAAIWSSSNEDEFLLCMATTKLELDWCLLTRDLPELGGGGHNSQSFYSHWSEHQVGIQTGIYSSQLSSPLFELSPSKHLSVQLVLLVLPSHFSSSPLFMMPSRPGHMIMINHPQPDNLLINRRSGTHTECQRMKIVCLWECSSCWYKGMTTCHTEGLRCLTECHPCCLPSALYGRRQCDICSRTLGSDLSAGHIHVLNMELL